MKEQEPAMTPPPTIPRGKRNARSHNHAVKSECLPLDQAAKIIGQIEMDETKTKRFRSKNYTPEEKEIFLKICHNYIHIIRNKSTDNATNELKNVTWETIAKEYSSVTKTQRTAHQMVNLYKTLRRRWMTTEPNQAEVHNSNENLSEDYLNYDSSTESSLKLHYSDSEPEANTSTNSNNSFNISKVNYTRSKNFTEAEKELFTNILSKYLYIINNRKQDYKSLDARNDAWQKITDEYNAACDGDFRTIDQLKILHKNMKSLLNLEIVNFESIEENNDTYEVTEKNELNTTSFVSNEHFNFLKDPEFEYDFLAGSSRSGQKRIRSRNFTEQEKDAFLQIMSEYIHIIENKGSDNTTLNTKSITWEKIAREYSEKTGDPRTCEQLYQLYGNMKKKAKKIHYVDPQSQNYSVAESNFNKIIEQQNYITVEPRFDDNPFFDNNSSEFNKQKDTNYPSFESTPSISESSVFVKMEPQENSDEENTEENQPEKCSLPQITEYVPSCTTVEKTDRIEECDKLTFLKKEHEMKMKILKLDYETKEKICAMDLIIKEKEKTISENNEKLSILNLKMKQKELDIKELEFKKLLQE